MAGLNCCGWETNTNNEMAAMAGTWSIVSSPVNTGSYAFRTNPATTAVGSCSLDLRTSAGGAKNTSYRRFYFRVATAPSSGDEPIFESQQAGSVLKFEVRLNSSRQLVAYDSVGSLGTGSTVLALDTWYRIEVLVNTGASVAWEVRINGTTELSGSAANTTTTGAAFDYLGKNTNRNGNTVDFYYDDWLASEDGWLGAGGILPLTVTSGTPTYAQWTGGTGSTYAEVDETVLSPDDANYWRSTANGDAHTAFLADPSGAGISGTINAVKVVPRSKRVTTNASHIARIRYSGTNLDGAAVTAISNPTWARATVTATARPGGGAWSLSDLTSTEIGVVDGAAVRCECMSLVAMVDFAAGGGGGGSFAGRISLLGAGR